MSSPPQQMHQDERRSFFRVNEELILDFHIVETKVAESESASAQFSDAEILNLFSDFRHIDTESAKLLHTIGETNHSLADYLANINKKFDILAQYILAEKNKHKTAKTTRVNLSEGGIAFAAQKAVYKGSFLALRLLFLPSYIGVAVFARVIRSEAKGDNLYHVAAKFHRLEETQQQILSKQIMHAQLMAKRRTRA